MKTAHYEIGKDSKYLCKLLIESMYLKKIAEVSENSSKSNSLKNCWTQFKSVCLQDLRTQMPHISRTCCTYLLGTECCQYVVRVQCAVHTQTSAFFLLKLWYYSNFFALYLFLSKKFYLFRHAALFSNANKVSYSLELGITIGTEIKINSGTDCRYILFKHQKSKPLSLFLVLEIWRCGMNECQSVRLLKFFWPLTDFITLKVKNNYAHVTTQRILNKFIDIKFSAGCVVWP